MLHSFIAILTLTTHFSHLIAEVIRPVTEACPPSLRLHRTLQAHLSHVGHVTTVNGEATVATSHEVHLSTFPTVAGNFWTHFQVDLAQLFLFQRFYLHS